MRERPFDAIWQRIERASAHHKRFGEKWNAHLDAHPYDTTVNIDSKGEGSVWIEQEIPPPDGLDLLLGEILYNLRAALDNCIYEVAVIDSGKDPPPRADQIQYPIYATAEQFANNKYRLDALSDNHRRSIELDQPYHGWDGPTDHPFAMLNDLARRDRHRQLHVIGAYLLPGTEPLFRVPPGHEIETFEVTGFGPFDRDTEVFRFRVSPPLPTNQGVEVNPQATIAVELADTPREASETDLGKRLFIIEEFVASTVCAWGLAVDHPISQTRWLNDPTPRSSE